MLELVRTLRVHEPCRIVIADDHPISRSGMVFLLSAESDLEIVGEAVDGDEVLKMVDELQPDVLILDVLLPGRTGLMILGDLVRRAERPCVLLMSGSVSGTVYKEALDLGAEGLLTKEDSADELLAAVAAVRAGTRYLSDSVTSAIGPLLDSDPDADSHLTQREREVLVLVAEGLSNIEIGERLGISANTVKKHRENIRFKLHITNAADATRAAARLGLIKLS